MPKYNIPVLDKPASNIVLEIFKGLNLTATKLTNKTKLNKNEIQSVRDDIFALMTMISVGCPNRNKVEMEELCNAVVKVENKQKIRDIMLSEAEEDLSHEESSHIDRSIISEAESLLKETYHEYSNVNGVLVCFYNNDEEEFTDSVKNDHPRNAKELAKLGSWEELSEVYNELNEEFFEDSIATDKMIKELYEELKKAYDVLSNTGDDSELQKVYKEYKN